MDIRDAGKSGFSTFKLTITSWHMAPSIQGVIQCELTRFLAGAAKAQIWGAFGGAGDVLAFKNHWDCIDPTFWQPQHG